ncbi:hypothetical protein ABZ499_32010 [Streptomyces sp. NPDC019990]|uniref:hypothetical protein n=1 Tax=Streptomyces sp. NPDC019990 TaxID=3154693 RepID=UPI0033F53B61
MRAVSAGDFQDVVKAAFLSTSVLDLSNGDRIVEGLSFHGEQTIAGTSFGRVEVVRASRAFITISLQGVGLESVVLASEDQQTRSDQRSSVHATPGFVVDHCVIPRGSCADLQGKAERDFSFFLPVRIQFLGLVPCGVRVENDPAVRRAFVAHREGDEFVAVDFPVAAFQLVVASGSTRWCCSSPVFSSMVNSSV